MGAAIVASAPDVRVLAAHRVGRGWELPGGKVEPGESPQEALVRELHEELGCRIVVGEEVRAPEDCWPINESLEMRVFLASTTDQPALLDGTHDTLRWVSPDELTDLDWLPADVAVAAVLADVLRPRPREVTTG